MALERHCRLELNDVNTKDREEFSSLEGYKRKYKKSEERKETYRVIALNVSWQGKPRSLQCLNLEWRKSRCAMGVLTPCPRRARRSPCVLLLSVGKAQVPSWVLHDSTGCMNMYEAIVRCELRWQYHFLTLFQISSSEHLFRTVWIQVSESFFFFFNFHWLSKSFYAWWYCETRHVHTGFLPWYAHVKFPA